MQPMAMLLKAIILMERKRFDEAIQILRDTIVCNVNNFDLYHTLVQAYLMQNKLHEVIFPQMDFLIREIFLKFFNLFSY